MLEEKLRKKLKERLSKSYEPRVEVVEAMIEIDLIGVVTATTEGGVADMEGIDVEMIAMVAIKDLQEMTGVPSEWAVTDGVALDITDELKFNSFLLTGK